MLKKSCKIVFFLDGYEKWTNSQNSTDSSEENKVYGNLSEKLKFKEWQ